MTSSSQPAEPEEWVSDKVGLDDLFRDAKPVGDTDWSIPDFFASDEEFEDFKAWLKAADGRSLIRGQSRTTP